MERVLRPLLLLLLCAAVVRSDAAHCGEPPTLENGNHTGGDYTFGQWVYYRCNEGCELIGSSRILCTDKGWSKLNCQCRITQCDPPQPVDNGFVRPRGEGTYGQQASYSCHRGYSLTGEGTVNCTHTGHWSHPTPNCTAAHCGEPPTLENGKHTGGDYTFRHWVLYSCNERYELIGSSRILCTDKGWSKLNCQCRKIKSSLPVGNPDSGESIKGSLQSNVTRCDPPQPVDNGTVWPRGEGTYGQQANYSCDRGYTLTGEGTVNCTHTGHWSHPAPNCTVTRCDPPQPVDNGTVWPRGEGTYGQQANYSCDEGYTLTGEGTVNCTHTGHWSHPAPNCTESIVEQSGRQTKTPAGYYVPAIIGAAISAVLVVTIIVTAAIGVRHYKRKQGFYLIGARSKDGEEPTISEDGSVTPPLPRTALWHLSQQGN